MAAGCQHRRVAAAGTSDAGRGCGPHSILMATMTASMVIARLAPLALLLAACAPEWTRPGATAAEIESDMGQCRADAEAKAPVDIVGVEPYPAAAPPRSPFTGFGGRIPTGVGSGYSGLAYEDANRAAREEIYERCMTARGYARKS